MRSLLQRALLYFFLAFDAIAGPRHGFQTLGVDFLATRDAFPESAFMDARQRIFHHLEQLPVIIALMKQKFLVVGTGCAVGNVLRGFFVHGAPVLFRARDHTPQVLLPRFQSFPESFQFLLFHKNFTSLVLSKDFPALWPNEDDMREK